MSESPRSLEHRTYFRSEAATFQKTNESHGGLSNMAPGFPLEVNGIAFHTSEALYQCCRFPHLPDVQRMLILERSPMTAKMKSKPYRQHSRPDFEQIKVTVMRWCLRVKLMQNWNGFRAVLGATTSRPIVEVSNKDAFWGAKPDGPDRLVGGNVLGRLLMELRELVNGPQSAALLQDLAPPNIPVFLLLGRPITTVTAERRTSPDAIASVAPQARALNLLLRTCFAGTFHDIAVPDPSLSRLFFALASLVSLTEDVEELEVTLRSRPGREEAVRFALLEALGSVPRPRLSDDSSEQSGETELPLFAHARADAKR